MNIEDFSDNDILKININQPETLFSGSESDIKKSYRKLSLLWHPDKNKNKDSSSVFSHIHELYNSALDKLSKGTLGTNNKIIQIIDIFGKKFNLKFMKVKKFEMGQYYIANNLVVWEFKNEFIKEVKKGLSNLEKLSFHDKKMEQAFKKYIPEIYKIIESKDVFYILVKKPKGFLNLGDIFEYYNYKLDPKHVAWIISNLYNQLCFIHSNKIMFGGINMDNYYINPETHEGMLVGGWWYSCKENEKLSMLSTSAIDIAPISLLNNKKSELLLDLEMIKLLGRELLGDKTGNYLKANTSIPEDLSKWFRVGSKKGAISEYSQWNNEVLIKSFGQRRFFEMKVNSDNIYREV